MAESYAGRDTVCGVARRHGLSPQQLFTWRRDAKRRGAVQAIEPMPFAPVVVATPATISAEPDGRRRVPRRATRRVGADASPIVIEAGAVVVRIGRGAETNTVEAILRALRGTP